MEALETVLFLPTDIPVGQGWEKKREPSGRTVAQRNSKQRMLLPRTTELFMDLGFICIWTSVISSGGSQIKLLLLPNTQENGALVGWMTTYRSHSVLEMPFRIYTHIYFICLAAWLHRVLVVGSFVAACKFLVGNTESLATGRWGKSLKTLVISLVILSF